MHKYSDKSEGQLSTASPNIQKVFRAVLEDGVDHSVLEGFRGQAVQEQYFQNGKTKVHWPQSKHNKRPAKAIDAMAYPYDWADFDGRNGKRAQQMAFYKQCMFIGYVIAKAKSMGIKLVSGIDWDGDWNIGEHNFHDLPHFEEVDEQPN